MATGLHRPYAEQEIWLPLARSPRRLGFPGAVALHNLQIGDQSGYVDLVLFPREHGLVLVEAKHAADARASADVLGQLLKYYSHALNLGQDGLRMMREHALRIRSDGRTVRRVSLKHLLQASSTQAAQTLASSGRALTPKDIHLIIALDAPAPRFEKRLIATTRALSRHHGIDIHVHVTSATRKRRWLTPAPGKRDR